METHAREIATRLSHHFDVQVVTSNPGRQLPSTEVLDGVTVRRIPTWPSSGDPFIPWGWSKLVREIGPDVIVIDGYQSVVSARALIYSTRRKTPVVLVFHEGANSNRLRQALYPLQRRILRRWFRRAHITVATAPHEIDLYRKELRLSDRSLVYIPNGADLPVIDEEVKRDQWKIVSIGRLELQKRHHLVVEALSKLREDGNPWNLTIIGLGPEKDNLEELSRELGLADVVRVVSFEGTERVKMATELSTARIVIAPSLFETYPMAVIEAAQLGCHVLVPEEGNPGVVGLADRGIAQSIPSRTSEDMARSVLLAVEHSFTVNRNELSSWDDCANEFRRLLTDIASS